MVFSYVAGVMIGGRYANPVIIISAIEIRDDFFPRKSGLTRRPLRLANNTRHLPEPGRRPPNFEPRINPSTQTPMVIEAPKVLSPVGLTIADKFLE